MVEIPTPAKPISEDGDEDLTPNTGDPNDPSVDPLNYPGDPSDTIDAMGVTTTPDINDIIIPDQDVERVNEDEDEMDGDAMSRYRFEYDEETDGHGASRDVINCYFMMCVCAECVHVGWCVCLCVCMLYGACMDVHVCICMLDGVCVRMSVCA